MGLKNERETCSAHRDEPLTRCSTCKPGWFFLSSICLQPLLLLGNHVFTHPGWCPTECTVLSPPACLGLGWSLHMAAFLHPQLEPCRGQNISIPNELLMNSLDFKHSDPWSSTWTSEPPLAGNSEPLQKNQHCSQSSLGCAFGLHFSASTKMERPRRHCHL